jgi:hypothetical protein
VPPLSPSPSRLSKGRNLPLLSITNRTGSPTTSPRVSPRYSPNPSPRTPRQHFFPSPPPQHPPVDNPSVVTSGPPLSFFFCPEEVISYTLLASCLPPTVTALQLATLFAPFGSLVSLELQIIASPDGQLYCGGTALLQLYGPIHLRDSALSSLNGALVFALHPPLRVSLLA